jgi:hypothetical protein
MSEREITDQATDEVGSVPIKFSESEEVKSDSLRGIRRTLREEELTTSGAIRLLMAEIDQLRGEYALARTYQDRYYSAETRIARLEGQQKQSTIIEILSTVCLAGGSVGMGAAKTYIEISIYGWVFFAISFVFTVAGIVARVWK